MIISIDQWTVLLHGFAWSGDTLSTYIMWQVLLVNAHDSRTSRTLEHKTLLIKTLTRGTTSQWHCRQHRKHSSSSADGTIHDHRVQTSLSLLVPQFYILPIKHLIWMSTLYYNRWHHSWSGFSLWIHHGMLQPVHASVSMTNAFSPLPTMYCEAFVWCFAGKWNQGGQPKYSCLQIKNLSV